MVLSSVFKSFFNHTVYSTDPPPALCPGAGLPAPEHIPIRLRSPYIPNILVTGKRSAPVLWPMVSDAASSLKKYLSPEHCYVRGFLPNSGRNDALPQMGRYRTSRIQAGSMKVG